MHVDDEAASQGPFGGLIASGWQTVMKCVRLWVDGLMADTAGAASPGLEDIRWLKPVRAGDRIAASVEVYEVADSKSRPDRGRVHFLFSGVDDSGAAVMTCRGAFFILRRPKDLA
jgi:acyl dehydratase